MLVTKQLTLAIDFHRMEKSTFEVNGYQHSNYLFCVQLKKAIQTYKKLKSYLQILHLYYFPQLTNPNSVVILLLAPPKLLSNQSIFLLNVETSWILNPSQNLISICSHEFIVVKMSAFPQAHSCTTDWPVPLVGPAAPAALRSQAVAQHSSPTPLTERSSHTMDLQMCCLRNNSNS